MENRQEWLRARKEYIGGSDIAGIIGISPYKSALDIYVEKVYGDIDDAQTKATYWGSKLEPFVANEYGLRTGLSLEIEPNVIRHPKHNFIAANIDRWVDGKSFVLECKTTGLMKSNQWGQEGTDQIPENYLCQVAWYALICDVPKVDIAVLIGGQDFKIFTYLRNEEFENKLLQIGINFWNDHVLKGIPPLAVNLRDISHLYTKSNGMKIQANSKILDKLDELKSLKEQEENLHSKIDLAKFEVQNFMKDYDTLVDPSNDNVIVTWKSCGRRAAIDKKRLERENKEIYLKYAKESKPYRIFSVK